MTTTHPKTTLLLFSTLLLLSLLHPAPAAAQTFDLSISPPLSHILIKPDTSVIQAFNIQNHTDHPVTLIARLVPFSPSNLTGIGELQFDSNPKYLDYFSLANANIRLNQPFSLAANSSDQLVVMVRFPKNADLSDYYTSLVVSQASPDQDKLTGTYLNASVIANILTSVNLTADPTVTLSLSDLELKGSLFQLGPYHLIDTLAPVTFSVIAKNHSPFLTTTTGSFDIKVKNKSQFTAGLKPIYLLAYSSRYLESSSSAGFTYQPKLFDLGVSTAVFTLNQNTGPVTLSQKLIIFPVKLFFALILLLSLLTFFFSPLRKKTQ